LDSPAERCLAHPKQRLGLLHALVGGPDAHLRDAPQQLDQPHDAAVVPAQAADVGSRKRARGLGIVGQFAGCSTHMAAAAAVQAGLCSMKGSKLNQACEASALPPTH